MIYGMMIIQLVIIYLEENIYESWILYFNVLINDCICVICIISLDQSGIEI